MDNLLPSLSWQKIPAFEIYLESWGCWQHFHQRILLSFHEKVFNLLKKSEISWAKHLFAFFQW